MHERIATPKPAHLLCEKCSAAVYPMTGVCPECGHTNSRLPEPSPESAPHSLEYPKCPRCGSTVVGAMMTSEAITGKDGQIYYHPDAISVYCISAACNYDRKLHELKNPPKAFPEPSEEQEQTFESEMAALINKYSIENESNTPDFILALLVRNVLTAFGCIIKLREDWYGHRHEPGQPDPATRCQDRSETGAQCLHPQGHTCDHLFREDTAAVWENPGEEESGA